GIIDQNVGKSGLRVARQGPKTRDDIAGSSSLLNNTHRGLAGFTRFGRIPCEPTKTSLRAHDDPGQWLIDLVNNGARELAERCEAYGSRKFISRVCKRLLRGLSFRDIGDDSFQFDIAGWAEVELSDCGDMQGRAVSVDDSVLVTERNLGTDGLRERFLQ